MDDLEKGIEDIVRNVAGKDKETPTDKQLGWDSIDPNFRGEIERRGAEGKKHHAEQTDEKGNLLSDKYGVGAKYEQGRISHLDSRVRRSKFNPNEPYYEALSEEDQALHADVSANPDKYNRPYPWFKDGTKAEGPAQEKSLTKRLLKLYKANDDPMTTKESFTTLTNEEARQQEHDQLLREYGFPSEVDPEANRYIPVIETETDDKGIPINTKGPWVVNEAGNDVGELLDEDAPSFSASEKAHNREGKETASVSKSYLINPPTTPFIAKRSL